MCMYMPLCCVPMHCVCVFVLFFCNHVGIRLVSVCLSVCRYHLATGGELLHCSLNMVAHISRGPNQFAPLLLAIAQLLLGSLVAVSSMLLLTH